MNQISRVSGYLRLRHTNTQAYFRNITVHLGDEFIDGGEFFGIAHMVQEIDAERLTVQVTVEINEKDLDFERR